MSRYPEGNTVALRLSGFHNGLTGAYINDATVTLESIIVDGGDTSVTGVTLPLTLDYLDGSMGDYLAIIPDTAALTAGNTYRAEIKAVDGSGYVYLGFEQLDCEKRED